MRENVAMRERIRAVEARCNQLEERMNGPFIHQPAPDEPVQPPELPDSPSPVPEQLVPAPEPPEPLLEREIRTYLERIYQSIEDSQLYVPQLHLELPLVRSSLTEFAEDNPILRRLDDPVSSFHAMSIDEYLQNFDAMLEAHLPTESPTLNLLVQSFRAEILPIRKCIEDRSLKSIVEGLTHSDNLALWSRNMEDMYRTHNDARERWFGFMLAQVQRLKESLFQLCDSITQLHWIRL